VGMFGGMGPGAIFWVLIEGMSAVISGYGRCKMERGGLGPCFSDQMGAVGPGRNILGTNIGDERCNFRAWTL